SLHYGEILIDLDRLKSNCSNPPPRQHQNSHKPYKALSPIVNSSRINQNKQIAGKFYLPAPPARPGTAAPPSPTGSSAAAAAMTALLFPQDHRPRVVQQNQHFPTAQPQRKPNIATLFWLQKSQ
ncbi:hypothetical protein, partial [Acidocella aminolytica]